MAFRLVQLCWQPPQCAKLRESSAILRKFAESSGGLETIQIIALAADRDFTAAPALPA